MNLRFPIIKLLFPLVLYCVALPIQAQIHQLQGIVYDSQSNIRIRGANITLGELRTSTGADGRFVIHSPNDTTAYLTITHIGYEPVTIARRSLPDTLLHIGLTKAAVSLEEVTVFGQRNTVKDSLQTREEFADQFNFKPVKPWEAIMISPVGIAINLNMLFAAFSREQKQSKRLKTALISEEHARYVDRRFTKALIQTHTKLSDEETAIFHWYFKPTYEQMIGFTDYDLLVYIQEKNREFATRRDDYPNEIPVLVIPVQ